jgi:hypothetical protein
MKKGHFFVTLILQSGCISSGFYLLRWDEIYSCYISAWLAHHKRKYINDSEPWRRREFQVFPFGYFYSQMITVFTIVLVFSTTVPLVTFAGLFYFSVRHIVDSFNLLTVHMNEINSSAGLVPFILIIIYRQNECLIHFSTQFSFIKLECSAFSLLKRDTMNAQL